MAVAVPVAVAARLSVPRRVVVVVVVVIVGVRVMVVVVMVGPSVAVVVVGDGGSVASGAAGGAVRAAGDTLAHLGQGVELVPVVPAVRAMAGRVSGKKEDR